MYLYSRRGRLNTFDGVAWATETAAAGKAATGVETQVWAAVYSPRFGEITWTSWYEDLAALETATDALLANEAYMAKSAEGGQFMVPGAGVDDTLFELVAGELDPEADPMYVSGVQAVCAGGNIARAMTAGVEIAQRADAATGGSTLFMRNLTGPYGGVSWVTGYADMAAVGAAQTAMAADAGWLELLDSTGGAFAAEVAATQSTLYRKLA